MRHLPLLLLVAGALLLVGCGNKGPLQLPVPTRPAAAAPAPASTAGAILPRPR